MRKITLKKDKETVFINKKNFFTGKSGIITVQLFEQSGEFWLIIKFFIFSIKINISDFLKQIKK